MPRQLIQLLTAVLLATLPLPGFAQQSAQSRRSEPLDSAQIRQAIRDLDSAEYDVRQTAFDKLADAARDDPDRLLSDEIQRALHDPATSFEVRARLGTLQTSPPTASVEGGPPPPDVDRLVERLQSTASHERAWASHELRLATARQDPTAAVMIGLKRALARPDLPAPVRRQLTPLWQHARGVWASSDPKTWRLPPLSDEQIGRWLDSLASPGDDPAAIVRLEAAYRELVDAACRDECLDKVRDEASRRLERADDPLARARLQEAFDWTRPALAAEVWADGRHESIQYMLVGVPQFPEGGWRASHFDPVDDKTAHCVSGNNLNPGQNYPVGVAIPFPTQLTNRGGAIFHLVYLPTPRRRIIYRHQLLRPEHERLAEFSQRTVDALLASKQTLYAAEMQMLEQLDRRVVSKFIGTCLASKTGATGDPSSLCQLLQRAGTSEALPDLEKTLRAGTFANSAAVVAEGWLALLAIVGRDPPTDADDLLARLIDRPEPLTLDLDPPPDVGATAAAALLLRHDAQPADFGLTSAATTREEESIGVSPYRFDRPDRRKTVLEWWTRHKAKPAAPAE